MPDRKPERNWKGHPDPVKTEQAKLQHKRERMARRARLIAELAATLGAGYLANPECSGMDARAFARHCVVRARAILEEAWETINDELRGVDEEG